MTNETNQIDEEINKQPEQALQGDELDEALKNTFAAIGLDDDYISDEKPEENDSKDEKSEETEENSAKKQQPAIRKPKENRADMRIRELLQKNRELEAQHGANISRTTSLEKELTEARGLIGEYERFIEDLNKQFAGGNMMQQENNENKQGTIFNLPPQQQQNQYLTKEDFDKRLQEEIERRDKENATKAESSKRGQQAVDAWKPHVVRASKEMNSEWRYAFEEYVQDIDIDNSKKELMIHIGRKDYAPEVFYATRSIKGFDNMKLIDQVEMVDKLNQRFAAKKRAATQSQGMPNVSAKSSGGKNGNNMTPEEFTRMKLGR